MNLVIVDDGANLVEFRRMNGAFLGSIEIAVNKAKTSARFPFSTRFVAELAYGRQFARTSGDRSRIHGTA
jgi:glc operon protein GlcG